MLIRSAKPVLREGDCLFANPRTRNFLLRPCAVAANAPPRGTELVDLLVGRTSGRIFFRFWWDDALPDGVVAVCDERQVRKKGIYEIAKYCMLWSRWFVRASVLLPDEVVAEIGVGAGPPSPSREATHTAVMSPKTRRALCTDLRPAPLEEAARELDDDIGELLGYEDWNFDSDEVADADVPDGVLAVCEDGIPVVTFWFELPVVPLEDLRAWAGRLKAEWKEEKERRRKEDELYQLDYGRDRLTVSQCIGDLIRADGDRSDASIGFSPSYIERLKQRPLDPEFMDMIEVVAEVCGWPEGFFDILCEIQFGISVDKELPPNVMYVRGGLLDRNEARELRTREEFDAAHRRFSFEFEK